MGVVGTVPAVMIQLFPPAVRFSGISFSYNLAYAIFGGLTPLIISLLIQKSPLAPALYVAALAVLGLVLGFRVRNNQARYPITVA